MRSFGQMIFVFDISLKSKTEDQSIVHQSQIIILSYFISNLSERKEILTNTFMTESRLRSHVYL